jgi:hypothetical protein
VAGWTATVCEYRYRVPDENCARGLVDALADFGFALVSCSPFRSRWPLPGDEAAGEWIVRAVDEQPYAMTAQGGRERDAVDRAARLVARDLREVPWSTLEHAHGPADDIPALIEALAHGHGEWDELHSELIGDDVLHQGTCYSATGHVMRFLAWMVTSDILPAGQRADVYHDLLYAATRHGSSLIGDSARGSPRTRTVRRAVDAGRVRHCRRARSRAAGAVAGRAAADPPAAGDARRALPRPGRAAEDRIVEMGRLHGGTDVAALLELTYALLAQDDQRAQQAADTLVAGVRVLDSHGLDAPGLPISIRASRLLLDAALRVGAPQQQA